jgi:phospholipid/cholesterol/gamma-HCH transport system substrate-binding protein
VDIGVVDKVEISPLNNKVRMDLKLNTRVKGFIKKDSYATIEPEGLVGSYFVALTVGSPHAEDVEDGDLIQSKEPVRMTEILEDAQGIFANVRRATDELSKTLSSINAGRGTLGKLVTDDKAYRNLEQLTEKADSGMGKAIQEIAVTAHVMAGVSGTLAVVALRSDTLVTNIGNIVSRLNRGEGTIGALLGERTIYDSLVVAVHNAVLMTEDAKAGASRFAEDMEALKHNFLFKGYFEDRGYWDKADFEQEIDKKITRLKQLEQQIVRQSEQLHLQEDQLRKREDEMRSRHDN